MNKRISLTELKNMVKESVIREINEHILGPGERFTPYSPEERERNFAPIMGKDRRNLYQKNPSYYYALLLKKGYTPEEAREEVKRMVGHDLFETKNED